MILLAKLLALVLLILVLVFVLAFVGYALKLGWRGALEDLGYYARQWWGRQTSSAKDRIRRKL